MNNPVPFNGTVIHVDRGLDKPYARAYHGVVDSRYRLFHNDSEYACGRYPPNYPMPAIPLTVLLAKDYVAIATPDWFEGELMEFIVLAEYEVQP